MFFPSPKSHEFLTVVVYHNPSDYPDKFVARGHYLNCKTKEYKISREVMVSETYRPIERELEDMGLVKCMRHQDDDPCILENWV